MPQRTDGAPQSEKPTSRWAFLRGESFQSHARRLEELFLSVESIQPEAGKSSQNGLESTFRKLLCLC